jgi:hypothetical protein
MKRKCRTLSRACCEKPDVFYGVQGEKMLSPEGLEMLSPPDQAAVQPGGEKASCLQRGRFQGSLQDDLHVTISGVLYKDDFNLSSCNVDTTSPSHPIKLVDEFGGRIPFDNGWKGVIKRATTFNLLCALGDLGTAPIALRPTECNALHEAFKRSIVFLFSH